MKTHCSHHLRPQFENFSIFSNKSNICPSNLAPSQCLLIIGLICSVYHHQLLCTLFWSTKLFITKNCYGVDHTLMGVLSCQWHPYAHPLYIAVSATYIINICTLVHHNLPHCDHIHLCRNFACIRIIIFLWFPLIFICTSATTNITINHTRSQTPLSHPYCYQVFYNFNPQIYFPLIFIATSITNNITSN
jgi:hypothetical protein